MESLAHELNVAGARNARAAAEAVMAAEPGRLCIVAGALGPTNKTASISGDVNNPAARGVAAAKIDRQAVFKGDCVSCHAANVKGRYGQQLFASVCAVCHEANPRATMVPDLHDLKDPTSEEFWRAWITSGKAGTLMPAFSTSQGGPLDDLQIASLAAYLNAVNPSHAPAQAAK